ncbi:MAG: YhcH/YjgK/YiaL family protein [Clostridium sp.]|nr:YhcH/YjgK/YiaL family protein [Clostridiaceae bacterium]MDD6073505.1 YhcH/YjgK/YiaL family protein [Clostridium sp.]MDY5483732.1 YhcH/YjgK/YiaL family protein [Clostridium sp.]
MSKTLNEKINESIAVLEGLDKENLELGKYVVNEDFFYLVQEYETKDPEIARHEAHEKYVDIQYMIQGKEQIDIAPAEKMEVEEPYNADRDVVFFKEPEQATHVVLTDGGYAVLYPADSHKPGLRVGKAAKVRKIVGKVRI